MTKIIRILALVVAFTSAGSLAAQTSINGGISALGIKSGDQDTKTYLGFYAGLTQNMKLSDHTGFAFSIYYNQFSGDVKTTVLGANHHSEYFENNINPSLAFNYRFILTEKSCIYLFLGPEANVVLSAKRDNWVDRIIVAILERLCLKRLGRPVAQIFATRLRSIYPGLILVVVLPLRKTDISMAKLVICERQVDRPAPAIPIFSRYENNASGEKIARVFLGVGLVF